MRHQHDFQPTERRGKIVICKCICGKKQILLIKRFSAEKAAKIDEILKKAAKSEENGKK